MKFAVNRDKCIICGMCIKLCPAKAIVRDNGRARINPELCTECGRCYSMCYAAAIERLEKPAEA